MSEITAFLVGILLFVLALSCLYWGIVRPILIKSVMYRLFAKRDALRNMAIDNQISKESSEYIYLQDFLCRTIACMPQIGLAQFFFFSVSKSGPNGGVKDFEETAPGNLKQLRKEAVEDAIVMMIINAPLFTAMSAMIVVTMAVAGKIRSIKIFQKAEAFVNTMEGNFQPA